MNDDFELDLNAAAKPKKVKQVATDEKLVPEVLPANEGALSVQVEPAIENDEMPNDRDLVNQLLGQIQMANSFARFADVVSLQKLKYIKDNKIYRSVAGVSMLSAVSGEKIADVGTWDGFCKALGLSVSKVDEDLLNLNTFGEEALKQLSSIGAGYRELRQYRKLPADEKTALIEAAKAGDKDQLLDLAETLIERHLKDKAELTAKLDDLEQDIKASGRRINNMNVEIERLESANERLKGKQRLTKFEEHTEAVRDECMHLQAGCELHLNSLRKLFDDVFYAEPTPESQLRIEQVYVAMSVAASCAFSMLEDVRELIPDFAPERIQGQHILTPEESERWLLDKQMLEGKHAADKLAREVVRENSKEGKRGRKIGSKNKVEE